MTKVYVVMGVEHEDYCNDSNSNGYVYKVFKNGDLAYKTAFFKNLEECKDNYILSRNKELHDNLNEAFKSLDEFSDWYDVYDAVEMDSMVSQTRGEFSAKYGCTWYMVYERTIDEDEAPKDPDILSIKKQLSDLMRGDE